jgi:steroid 5-alpha reductase family enzyme
MNLLTSGILLYTSSKTPFTSQTLGWKQYLGIGLFAAGIALEVLPEETRRAFKKKPENKGKVDDTGMWG